ETGLQKQVVPLEAQECPANGREREVEDPQEDETGSGEEAEHETEREEAPGGAEEVHDRIPGADPAQRRREPVGARPVLEMNGLEEGPDRKDPLLSDEPVDLHA